MIIVRINMDVLPEKLKEVGQTLLSLTAPTQSEAGCISYKLFCDMRDKNLLCILEEWENSDHLDQHLKSDIFGVLLGTKSLLHKSHGIDIYTVRKSEGIDLIAASGEHAAEHPVEKTGEGERWNAKG